MAVGRTGIHLDSIIAPPPLDENQTLNARLQVARHSNGVEECREFLDMLGLNFTIDESIDK